MRAASARVLLKLLLALLALLGTNYASAQTTCWFNAASPTGGYSAMYDDIATINASGTLTVRCQTTSGNQSVQFTVTANNGLQPSGAQNRAQAGSSYINYDLYTDNKCDTLWPGVNRTITARTSGTNSSVNFRTCVFPTNPAPSSGYHTDQVQFTLQVNTPGVTITGTNPWVYPVNVGVGDDCYVSIPPGPLNFGTYTAFSPTALTASVPFTVRCTVSRKSLTFDIGSNASGVVPNTGLNYSLAIRNNTSGGSNPFTSTANNTANSPKTFYINGTIPANQAGTCTTGTCSGSDVRTLTVTY